MAHVTVKQKELGAFAALKEAFHYRNAMQSPRLTKVVVAVGTGSVKDPKRGEFIQKRLSTITGQKPSPRGAKKSMAAWKTRTGDVIGYQVTLRGERMYHFLDRFFSIALPRMKDFRGIYTSIIDDVGNATMGIKEHTIFPETADEEIRDVFGLAVTIVTTAKTKDEARAFLKHIGVPFREGSVEEKKKPERKKREKIEKKEVK